MNKKRGFTLIELLVVIAVLSLLASILLPALRHARAIVRATASLSNLRQWGIGTIMWAGENNNFLPWEGNETTRMYENFESDKWWANAVPPMLSQPTYQELSEKAIDSGNSVPLPPEHNIFVDPAATFPYDNREAILFYDSTYRYEYQLFFCYVFNSELNNGPTASLSDDLFQVKTSHIPFPSQTVLMIEMRTTNEELDPNDYRYYRARGLLGRHRGDWKRIARRHLGGTHMVFCDGHAERVGYEWASTNKQGSRDPDYPNGDWNKEGLIWNPFGPSLK